MLADNVVCNALSYKQRATAALEGSFFVLCPQQQRHEKSAWEIYGVNSCLNRNHKSFCFKLKIAFVFVLRILQTTFLNGGGHDYF